jgi:Zn-dependent peptidase ImmA (M78 family)
MFTTTDIVSIFPKSTNGVSLENAADIIVPDVMAAKGITAIVTETDLLTLYAYYGISDRTITYKASASGITFTQRG